MASGSLSARRAHEPSPRAAVGHSGSLTSRQAGISMPTSSDMISKKWTPVERNTLWREHVKKEVSHSAIRTAYTRDPRTMVMITEKPHQRRWQPSAPTSTRTSSGGRSRTHIGALAPLTNAPHQQQQQPLIQPVGEQPHTGGDHVTMGVPAVHHTPQVFHNYQNEEKELPSPADAPAKSSTSVSLPLLQLPANPHDHRDDGALLASLRHAELSPREKFAYPTTSSHEYGWQHDPLVTQDRTDIERNHRGKRLCAITQYAHAYYVQQKMNPFSINAR